MKLTTVRLVTIIAEPVLKDRLIHEIYALGAHGYTISEVHGEGTRGIHASQWQGATSRSKRSSRLRSPTALWMRWQTIISRITPSSPMSTTCRWCAAKSSPSLSII